MPEREGSQEFELRHRVGTRSGGKSHPLLEIIWYRFTFEVFCPLKVSRTCS